MGPNRGRKLYNPRIQGPFVADLAAEASRSPLDLVCDLLRATEGQVIAVLHLMAESDVSNILARSNDGRF